MPHSLTSKDVEIKALYRDAARQGYAVSLITAKGELLAVANWLGGCSIRELAPTRWQEYVDPDHLPGLLAWIADPKAPDGFTYRGVCMPDGKPTMLQYSASKRCGETLRLILGVSAPWSG
jgi:hypothetical protein